MRMLMQIAEDARRSKYAVAKLGTNDKNRGILAIADTLMTHADEIIAANRIDIENGRAAGLNDGLIDRLMLDEKRIAGIAEGCRQVAALPDPVGEVLWMHKRPNVRMLPWMRLCCASRPVRRAFCAAARRRSSPPCA